MAADDRRRDAGAPILLVQITDCHLLADAHAELRGVLPEHTLAQVCAQIARDGHQPDVLLVTGDIAHDGSEAAYRRFAERVQAMAPVIRVLPGNKDDGAQLRASLRDWTPSVTDVGNWRIVTLDSTIAGQGGGRLSGIEFAKLDAAVADAGERHILVALHHNPVQTDSTFDDRMMLGNARILLQHLTAWRQARVLMWGHVHQAFDCRLDNMRMLTTPATSFQFAIRDGQVVQDAQSPGYRWLKLYDDGSIATSVVRVDGK
ncbi:metallophosphoesterase [Schauerella aestuarii]|uniref:metallophosphoesterase n=1 Tax=Schauerella aestuarii TaxID=2511204 RepID=UPI002E2A9A71|nr:metallophosphoesterase [Achromobacter aestuarii]